MRENYLRPFLFAIIILTIIPASLFAYSGGSGTSSNPYKIATIADWQQLKNTSSNWNKCFIMTADVNLAGVTLTPVGNKDTYFTGIFDGKGYVIRNAVINLPSSNSVGLFGFLGPTGQIKNLGVKNAIITGKGGVGGLLGSNNGNITSCYSTGTVSGSSQVGGLVGCNYEASANNCYSTSQVGGSQYVGGLAGYNFDGNINNSYAKGQVSGTREVGGLVGRNYEINYYSRISNCYSTGSVIGTGDYAGGLAGYNYCGSISNCYSTGEVNGFNHVGGLVAYNDGGSILNSFWNIETSKQNGSSGGKGLTTIQMKMLSIFRDSGWGTYNWMMADTIDYPRLSWEATGYPAIPPSGPVPLTGSGTEVDPYQICSAADFAKLSWYPAILDKHIVLMNDINVIDEFLYTIGDLGPFTGFFNGNNHIIQNAVINLPSSDYVGLFGYLGSGGQIKNLTVVDVNIAGHLYTGGLVGYNFGSVISCYVAGDVRGDSYIGGLTGSNGGNVTNCYSTGSVSGGGDYGIGGLVGSNNTNVTNCYSASQVSGGNDVGGLVGWNGGSVSSCYSTGAVSGFQYVGGLVGYYYSGSISNCYSIGEVNGFNYVGGLVAYNENGSILNSFWNIETSDQNDSFGGKGLNTIQMKMLSIFRDSGWGSYNWVMADGLDYPHLIWEATGYPVIPPPGHVPLTGSGTEVDPYQIWTVADFAVLSWHLAILDKQIVLMDDIEIEDKTSLYPIGEYLGQFTGVFNGNNHIIHNVVINLPSCDNIGLFGYLGSSGQIKNLGLKGARITGRYNVGGLAGASCGNISNCYMTGTVNGFSVVGGLVGENRPGNITSCYSAISVNAFYNIGGLVGVNDGNISNCYSAGAVSGSGYIGGLVGINDGSINNSFSTSSVIGDSSNWDCGGLVGFYKYGTALMSFWDVNTSGQATSSEGTGKTTSEMKTLSTFTSANWDFSYTDGNSAVWFMPPNDYPILTWQISPADIFTDGRNNFKDFAVLAKYWLRDDCAIYNDFCDFADLDFSGSVDIKDIIELATYWLEDGIY